MPGLALRLVPPALDVPDGNRQYCQDAERQHGIKGALGFAGCHLAADVRQQETNGDDAGQGRRGEAPGLERRQPGGVADDVERNEGQKPGYEDHPGQRILGIQLPQVQAFAEPSP